MVKLDEVKRTNQPSGKASTLAASGVPTKVSVKAVAQPRPQKKTHHDSMSDHPQSKLRGRSLIYIDLDDDVTSIVDKIKAADNAVVALVPPKRSNTLHSVVNLKLLNKAAKDSQKVMAIVTTDQSLTNLAAGLEIPVAKSINAQAKAASTPLDDEIDDVIDGDDDVVLRPDRQEDKEISAAVQAIENDDRMHNDNDANGVPDDEQAVIERDARRNIKPKRQKVRTSHGGGDHKKLLIVGGVALVLAALLVWAIGFAPHAIITIKAKTSNADVQKTLSLVPSSAKNVESGVLPPVVQTKKDNQSVQFEATGSKETGEKATGKVAVCNKQTKYVSATSRRTNDVTIPAGTLLYANGVQFTTDADVTVEGYDDDDENERNCVDIKATAVNIGDAGNISDRTLLTISGYSQDKVAASADGAFTGGSKKTVKVVQQSDVDSAVSKLHSNNKSDSVKSELEGKMSNGVVIIDGSFSAVDGNVKVSPEVGQEADGQVTASIETTYTLVGVERSDLKDVVEATLNSQIDSKTQKIYANGLNNVKFTGFKAASSGYSVNIRTTGQIGPQVDEDSIKSSAVGKKSEEIKANVKEENSSVSDVEVQLTPFWVQSAPSADRITVNFSVDE